MHVKSEYDYRFESDFRKEIFDAIKYVYYLTNKANLPIYAVPDKLKEYSTSKKDIIQGVEVNPNEQFRDKSEDIYEEGSGSGASFNSNNSTGATTGFDEISQWNNEVSNTRSESIFIKNKNEKVVDLKDFVIKSVIGKGSFGKVFLV